MWVWVCYVRSSMYTSKDTWHIRLRICFDRDNYNVIAGWAHNDTVWQHKLSCKEQISENTQNLNLRTQQHQQVLSEPSRYLIIRQLDTNHSPIPQPTCTWSRWELETLIELLVYSAHARTTWRSWELEMLSHIAHRSCLNVTDWIEGRKNREDVLGTAFKLK